MTASLRTEQRTSEEILVFNHYMIIITLTDFQILSGRTAVPAYFSEVSEKPCRPSDEYWSLSGKELWAVVSSALALARQNPTPFVSAVRIVEREEALDRAYLEERGGSRSNSRPLPPGRPRCWRACFFQVSPTSYNHYTKKNQNL